MARVIQKWSEDAVRRAIAYVESKGALPTLEEFYAKVAKVYAGFTADSEEFMPLSPQVVKARIEELREQDAKLEIKTTAGRRSGGSAVDSKKDIILSGLNKVKSLLESDNSAEALTEIAAIRVIVESLHARKKTEETAVSSESEELVEPVAEESAAA